MSFSKCIWAGLVLVLWCQIEECRSSYCCDECQSICSYKSCVGSGFTAERAYHAVTAFYHGSPTEQDIEITKVVETEANKIFGALFNTVEEICNRAEESGTSNVSFVDALCFQPSSNPETGRRRRRSTECFTNYVLSVPTWVQDMFGAWWKVAALTASPPATYQAFDLGYCSNAGAQCFCGTCQQFYKMHRVLVIDSTYNPPFSFKTVYLPTHCGCAA